MTEIEDTLEGDDEDEGDEDEEYEALSDEVVMESALNFNSLLEIDESVNDDNGIESFELPGTFEQKVIVWLNKGVQKFNLDVRIL